MRPLRERFTIVFRAKIRSRFFVAPTFSSLVIGFWLDSGGGGTSATSDSKGGRPEDVLHLLLGDVYAEVGKLEQAHGEYLQITGASAFAGEQVKTRLADLPKGAISPASIGQVRAITGSGCVMCHAPGTDN